MDPRVSETQQQILYRNTLENHNYSNEEDNDDEDNNDVRDRILRENGVSGLNGRENGSEGASGHRTVRYRECLKNHAANMGSHAVDGCGEFMHGGAEGTAAALKCQACGCHRNFHRREAEGEWCPPYVRTSSVTALPYNPSPRVMYGPPAAAAMPVRFGGEENERVAAALALVRGSAGGGRGRKRFRTKFTPEQKAKMEEFAERVGWRIQKQDEADVERFCADVGVRRNVLKVWMHNNKNTLAKKSS